ncbi:MAG: hypothetical protein WDW38_009244 [Sanguina aurantia]
MHHDQSQFGLAHQLHVLLVDIETQGRVTVGALLRRCQYQVTVSVSAMEAMAQLASIGASGFNLLLLSWTAPGEDATKLLNYLRHHAELNSLPVAVVAGGKHLAAAQQSLAAAGCPEHVFTAPSTREELQLMLAAAVETPPQEQLQHELGGSQHQGLSPATHAHGLSPATMSASSAPPSRSFETTDTSAQAALHSLGHASQDPQQQHRRRRSSSSAHVLTSCKPVKGMSPPPEHLLHLAPSGLTHSTRHQGPANPPSQHPHHHHHQQPQLVAGNFLSEDDDPPLTSHNQPAVLGKRSRAAPTNPIHTPEYTTLLRGLLLQPGRRVSSLESLDIFCQVLCQLQLLHPPLPGGAEEQQGCSSSSSAAAGGGTGVPGGVRPSRLLLHRDGVVEFSALNALWCSGRAEEEEEEDVAGCSSAEARPSHTTAAAEDPHHSGQRRGGQPHPSAVVARALKPGAKSGSGSGSSSGGTVAEDLLYRSPEEEAGHRPTPASDIFSLGLLFLELFHRPATPAAAPLPHPNRAQPSQQHWHEQHPLEQQHSIHQRHLAVPGPHDFLGCTSSYAPCDTDAVLADVASLFGKTSRFTRSSSSPNSATPCPGSASGRSTARADMLAQARHRQLPASFLAEQPQEAAFTLALLAHRPRDRPTLAALMTSDLLRETCETLQEQWQEQDDEESDRSPSGGSPAAGRAEQPHSAQQDEHRGSGWQGTDQPILAQFLTCMRDSTAAAHARVASDLSALVADIAFVQQQLSLLQVQQRQQGLGSTCAKAGALGGGHKHDSPRHQQQQDGSSRGSAGPLSNSGQEAGHGTPIARLRSVATSTSLGGPIHVGHTPGDYDTDMDPQGHPVGVVETRWARLAHIQPHLEALYFKHRATAPAPPPPPSPPPPPPAAPAAPPASATAASTSTSGELRMRSSWTGLSGDLSLRSGSDPHLLDLDAIAPAVAGGPPVLQGKLQGGPGPRAGLCLPSSSVPIKAPPRGVRPQPPPSASGGGRDDSSSSSSNSGLPAHLSAFTDDLHSVVQYERLEVVASVRYGDSLSSSNMVCSTAFDRDDEFFATAGVGKRIRIYETAKLHNPHRGARGGGGGGGGAGGGQSPRAGSRLGDSHEDIAGVHFPVMEISSRSRLSCVCWSTYVKNQLVSSDYEGVVQLWDAHTGTELQAFEEHSKRVWSVDFSTLDPTRLVSGSDDGLVKLWSIHSEASTATIAVGANVCSVQFSPEASHLIALGAANHRVYLYDLRRTASPLMSVAGHERAVSYVRFMPGGQLASASTDSTLKLWDTKLPAGTVGAVVPASVQTFRGHRNERNFVGLSASSDGYLACGSEDHNVFVYHRSLPIPVASCEFGGPRPRGRSGLLQTRERGGAGSSMTGDGGTSGMESEGEDVLSNGPAGGGSMFVSSVCWSRKGDVLIAANSVGIVRLLKMV